MFSSIIINTTDLLFEFLLTLHKNKKTIYKSNINDEQTFMKLINFLEEKQFPAESFDFNCPVSKYFASYAEVMTPDLTIVDPNTLQPLAFFKTYRHFEEFLHDSFYDAAYHFNKHSNNLFLIPYYVVFHNVDRLEFYNVHSMFKFGKKPNRELVVLEPINYKILQSNCHNRIAHNQIIDRNKLQQYGKIAFSVIIPIISIILLILDALNIYTLSSLRLTVYGIILISVLIPYLTQITIKDVSLIFKNSKKE